jgi:hypothetical protein
MTPDVMFVNLREKKETLALAGVSSTFKPEKRVDAGVLHFYNAN